ncbi:hypothetical protein [Sphingomonas sp. OK281]|uniref:hypothetical protein n=1 Tax=Sphingomonas sp. OK281 TaxID=1881067 RepID=UPI0008F3421D|nr:hypothetical protein [Sphingomonas sp. OK281]SFO26902.1 hypothetical protein SAMN05428984_3082 [Sphingomonas sp. OK281]
MTGHSDYDTDFDEGRADPRSDDEWEGVWNVEDRNRDTLRKIEIGLAAIGATVGATIALFMVRAGWLRMARSQHIVPSAADIHVRMPPPR